MQGEINGFLDPDVGTILLELIKKILYQTKPSLKRGISKLPMVTIDIPMDKFVRAVNDSLNQMLIFEAERYLKKSVLRSLYEEPLQNLPQSITYPFQSDHFLELNHKFGNSDKKEDRVKSLFITIAFLATGDEHDENREAIREAKKRLLYLVEKDLTYKFRSFIEFFLMLEGDEKTGRYFKAKHIKTLSERLITILNELQDNDSKDLFSIVMNHDKENSDIIFNTTKRRLYHQIGYFLSLCCGALYKHWLLEDKPSNFISSVNGLKEFLENNNSKILRLFKNHDKETPSDTYLSFIQAHSFIPHLHFWIVSQCGYLELLDSYITDDILKRIVKQGFGDLFVRIIKSFADHLEVLATTLSMMKQHAQEQTSNDDKLKKIERTIYDEIVHNTDQFKKLSKLIPSTYHSIIDESIRGNALKKITWYLLMLNTIIQRCKKDSRNQNICNNMESNQYQIVASLESFFMEVSLKGIFTDERSQAYAALATCSMIRRNVSLLASLAHDDNFHFLNLYHDTEFLPNFLIGLITLKIAQEKLSNDRNE